MLALKLGITIVFKMPEMCAPTLLYYYTGCWYEGNPKTVYISPKLKGRIKTETILHEIGHSIYSPRGDDSEKTADDFAGVMMKKYKW